MKVGDLVKIKYDGVLALVCRVSHHHPSIFNGPYRGDPRALTWVHLLNQPAPFRPEMLEVVNEGR